MFISKHSMYFPFKNTDKAPFVLPLITCCTVASVSSFWYKERESCLPLPERSLTPTPSKVYLNEELSRYMLHFLYFLWSVSGLKIAGSVSSYLQYKNTHSSISLKQWVEQLSFACVVISRDLWNCLILNMILNMILKLASCVRSDMKKAVTLSTYYLNSATQTVLHLCIFFTAGLHGVN